MRSRQQKAMDSYMRSDWRGGLRSSIFKRAQAKAYSYGTDEALRRMMHDRFLRELAKLLYQTDDPTSEQVGAIRRQRAEIDAQRATCAVVEKEALPYLDESNMRGTG